MRQAEDSDLAAPPDPCAALEAEIARCAVCAARFAATRTAHAPRPVTRFSATARILVAGQAPGARVQASGLPFDDRSGDRLRLWLGVDRAAFYDREKFAIAPMAFCFPGHNARGADLPPPPCCAELWRAKALAAMPQIELTLLIGAHAQRWALGPENCGAVSDVVRRWREFAPGVIPLPHPSWRNSGWLKRNTWFESDLLPHLRRRIAALI